MNSANLSDLWLMRPKPNPSAGLRLFCFPYSGGGPSIFYSWARDFPSNIEVCAVQLPGRASRFSETPFSQMKPLVQAAAEAMLPVLDKPFAIFGHSMGALVSFELARHLRQVTGHSPVHLFVSGHSAPQIPRQEQPLRLLPENEFWEKVRELNGTPAEVLQHSELKELLLPLLRADFAVCETYVYIEGKPLECPITALGGEKDPHVKPGDIEAWSEQTTRGFAMHLFEGDHFFLNTARPQVLNVLAKTLNEFLLTPKGNAHHDQRHRESMAAS